MLSFQGWGQTFVVDETISKVHPDINCDVTYFLLTNNTISPIYYRIYFSVDNGSSGWNDITTGTLAQRVGVGIQVPMNYQNEGFYKIYFSSSSTVSLSSSSLPSIQTIIKSSPTINTEVSNLDYAICYNLTNVIDTFINELSLTIDDIILARAIELHSINTFNYLVNEGYKPLELSLKEAVHMCNSELINSILENNIDLIKCLETDDIEFLFNYIIDEETVETVNVLLNYCVDTSIFTQFYKALISNTYKSNYEIDISNELIDLLQSNGVIDADDADDDAVDSDDSSIDE